MLNPSDMAIDNTLKINRFLFPFSLLYGLGARFRNQLFSWGILPTEQYTVPVICVGNLCAGGSGKTPHTEYIVDLLRPHYRVAVLSRGYKRKTSGFLLASPNSTSTDIGDEPFQLKQKFPKVLVAVDANRRRGIRTLLALPEDGRPEVIVLDDAFQHRYVTPSLSIVLTDFQRLFYADKLLPEGRLREPIDSIRRADVVIVTKCDDDLKPIEFRIIEENMKLQAHQELFFTCVRYGNLTPVFPTEAPVRSLKEVGKSEGVGKEEDILVLSGIASPKPFIKEIEKYSHRVVSHNFPDHHSFTRQNIRKINHTFEKMTSPGKLIIVTEKDAARLLNNPYLPAEWKRSLYYLPITLSFCLDKQQTFDTLINKHISAIQRNKILG